MHISTVLSTGKGILTLFYKGRAVHFYSGLFNVVVKLYYEPTPKAFAPVVKWISRLASNQLLGVRVPPGALS